MWWEVILDALKDTAILFPFLFLMYVIIELTEHNTRMVSPIGRYREGARRCSARQRGWCLCAAFP